MTVFDRISGVCRMVFKILSDFHRHILEKCHYDSEGDRFTFPERRMAFMQNAAELIGILQAISIVAKSLAVKLMQIEKDVQAYEAGAAAAAGRRRAKKGWKW